MQTETKQGIVESILMEMDQEAEVTRKLFAIIPEDRLDWRPHPRARSLGELAMHIATLPGSVAELGDQDHAQVNFPPEVEAASRAEIIKAFAESFRHGREIVAATDESRLANEWTLSNGEQQVLAMPRILFWRSVLLNHNYHHRGQLATYLRILDVPLPSIYGPSADENPFA